MAMQKKIFIFAFLIMAGCLAAVGCGKTEETTENRQVFLIVKDDLNRQVALVKKPERIISLSPSFLELLGAAKADLIARPSSKSGIPAFAEPLEEVGAVYNINIEKVVALKPDLVIAYQGMHDKLVPVLESNHIPVIVLKMKTFEDVKEKLALFGRITSEEQAAERLTDEMDGGINVILEKLPPQAKKVAILHGSAKNITLELESSIAGSTAKLLGFVNVISGDKAKLESSDTVPYSMETLVEKDPEIIFVVTMGNLAEIKKRMLADVESNPAWSSLSAVKNKKVFFLPQELFLLNPGIHYPLAFQTMAALAYPEVFKNGQ